MVELSLIQRIAVWVLPVLFAITVHEVAHGWVARRLGDPTAMMMGRLTLNPIKHIDPVGTLLMPGLLLLVGAPAFGWARPVPVTWQNLRRPKRDMALVALAGPGANLLMAGLWAALVKVALAYMDTLGVLTAPMVYMGIAGIYINTVLLVLNLLPLPPLDGGRVLVGVLPGPLAWQVSRIEPYGLFILLGLLFLGWLGHILWPIMVPILAALAWVSGVPAGGLEAVLYVLIGGGGN